MIAQSMQGETLETCVQDYSRIEHEDGLRHPLPPGVTWACMTEDQMLSMLQQDHCTVRKHETSTIQATNRTVQRLTYICKGK
jgi:hypothetical protein